MSRFPQAKEQALLSQIKEGDERVLFSLYEQYRQAFLRWTLKHHKCTEEEAAEVYQKSFTIFYYNIRDGKLTELASTLETYLFGIGKRVLMELYRSKARQGVDLEEVPEAKVLDTSYLRKESASHQQKVVAALLAKMGKVCQEVLKLYYFKKYSMEAIAAEVGYKNENVAKKKKYECLKKLKEMVNVSGLDAQDLLDQ